MAFDSERSVLMSVVRAVPELCVCKKVRAKKVNYTERRTGRAGRSSSRRPARAPAMAMGSFAPPALPLGSPAFPPMIPPPPPTSNMPWYFAMIGVALYVVFRTTMALGANLQRYSMRREAAAEHPRRKMRQPLLVLGVVLFAGSGICLSVPLIFAPQSLLSPCGVIIFVANAIFATCLNGETFLWRRDGVCLVGVTAGVIMCVFAAPKESHGHTTDELIELLKQPPFIVFMSLLLSAIIFLLVSRWRLIAAIDTTEGNRVSPRTQVALAGCLGTLAGCLGGLNITCTKSIFSLIQGTFETSGVVGVLTSPATWFIGISLGLTYVSQIRATTDGLQRCVVSIFVPVQTVTEESIATLGGLIYFREFMQFDVVRATLFAVGMTISITSVTLLTALRIRRDGLGTIDMDSNSEMPEIGCVMARTSSGRFLRFDGDVESILEDEHGMRVHPSSAVGSPTKCNGSIQADEFAPPAIPAASKAVQA